MDRTTRHRRRLTHNSGANRHNSHRTTHAASN